MPSAMAVSPQADGLTRGLDAVRNKIAPLRLAVSNAAEPRVNVLVPSLEPGHVFGGRIAQLNLALTLSKSGQRVRVLLTDDPSLSSDRVRHLQAYENLGDFAEQVEVGWASDRSVPVEVSRNDRFLATSWWSAHLANAACRELGRPAFVYLIQEYQPLAHPLGTWAALADQSYNFRHFALFSTGFLRDFFQGRRLGVFREDPDGRDGRSAVFRNALSPVPSASLSEMSERMPRRLLLYARPERHAERNMFNLAVLGIRAAVEEGLFADGWEILGVGKQGAATDLGWGPVHIRLLPRMDQMPYGELLAKCDVGLALQYTAHPGLLPLEMASAGMITVTNHFENKTASALQAVSSNLVPVEATVDGIVEGLREAVRRCEDYRAREAGARFDWPRTWDRAFDRAFIGRVLDFLEAS